MQQIKQELQKTIAQLKGEWGINNFSLQDLAAILEKVVAALDRAAQLPEPAEPAGTDFDKHFFRVVVVGRGKYNYQGKGSMGSGYPSLAVNNTGPMGVYKGFFDLLTKSFYERDENGRTLDDLAQGRMLYNRKTFMHEGIDSYGNKLFLGVNGQALNGDKETTDDLDDPNWEF